MVCETLGKSALKGVGITPAKNPPRQFFLTVCHNGWHAIMRSSQNILSQMKQRIAIILSTWSIKMFFTHSFVIRHQLKLLQNSHCQHLDFQECEPHPNTVSWSNTKRQEVIGVSAFFCLWTESVTCKFKRNSVDGYINYYY